MLIDAHTKKICMYMYQLRHSKICKNWGKVIFKNDAKVGKILFFHVILDRGNSHTWKTRGSWF